jgi:hypothetical protein
VEFRKENETVSINQFERKKRCEEKKKLEREEVQINFNGSYEIFLEGAWITFCYGTHKKYRILC